MLKNRVKGETGFTVVEVMVAGVILGIGVLGSITIFDSSRRESATGERLQVAQALAEAELERVRDVSYPELATDGAETWPASERPGDPSGRIVGDSDFRAAEGDEGIEPLALADAGTGIDPYSEPQNVTVDGNTFEMSVYRFVSWRDVDCQVVDLTPFKSGVTSAIEDLLAQIDSANGRIDALITALAPNLLSLPLLNELRAQLLGLESGALSDLEDQLDALLAALNGLEEIDPCDVEIETLNEINDALDVLGPTLQVLDDALLNAVNAPACRRVILTVICPPTTTTTYNTAIDQIEAFAAEDWAETVGSLAESADKYDATDHGFNTKRVTVAIVLKPTTGSGPFKPVWATSIVSDPEAGVLGG